MKGRRKREAAKQQRAAVLLDLLSPQATGAAERAAQLDPADIQAVAALARQHRIGPLLHWIAVNRGDLGRLPPALASGWGEAREQMALHSLTAQRSLVFIHDTLTRAGMPYIALKGTYLAFHAYPEYGLRPLRDIDILVPKGREIEAFRLLQEHGAQIMNAHAGHHGIAIDTALELNRKHLPQLRAPGNGMVVEVHSHLFHAVRAVGMIDLADDPELWLRRITRPGPGGRDIGFMEHGDLLLHLIVHAVFDHRFDNGPLTLSDLAFLLRRGMIEWSAFWDRAAWTGCTRGAILALRLVEHHWGPCGVDYAPAGCQVSSVDQAILSDAAALMLRDFDVRRQVEDASRIVGLARMGDKVRYVASRLFRDRREIAEIFSADPRSPWIFRYYPLLWTRLITRFDPTRFDARDPEVQKLLALEKWLK